MATIKQIIISRRYCWNKQPNVETISIKYNFGVVPNTYQAII